MSKRMPCSDELKDKHLDMILKMAYEYENTLKSQQMLGELEEVGKECSEADSRNAFALFLKKYEQQQAQQRHQARKVRARRIISRTLEVAACVVLVMAIATPIAIAKVDAIRVKVLELLIDVKDDHTELSIIEDEEAAFEVPAGWKGVYYLSYIPDEYQFVEIDDMFCQARYQNANGDDIYFSEYNPTTEVNLDSEDAEISYADINGTKGLIIQKTQRNYIMISWAFEDKFFLLESQGTLDEALKMARSVRRI